MRIKIQADTVDKEEEIEFSDTNLDNDNFVNMIVGGKEYIIGIDDLLVVGEAFKRVRELNFEMEKAIKN